MELGAAEIFFAARDCGENFPQAEPFVCGAFQFAPCFGFDILEKTLFPAPAEFRPYRLKRLSAEALEAVVSSHTLRGLHFEGPAEMAAALPGLPAGLVADAGHVLANAASPAFTAALVGAALGFWLMVLRRQRAG